MQTTRVVGVSIPAGTLAEAAGFTDYRDAFRIRVDDRFPDPESFARALIRNPPHWIGRLMQIRDSVVGVFGLKTAKGMPPPSAEAAFEVGEPTGLFHVVARTPTELLLGEDDRHLDFRLSILRTEDVDGPHVTLTTVVRFHNALGRAYFLPVAPIHRRVVPAMMRAALRS